MTSSQWPLGISQANPTTSRRLNQKIKFFLIAVCLGASAPTTAKVNTPWWGEPSIENSATGTRTRVARVRAEYPNQLDYGGHVDMASWYKFAFVTSVRPHSGKSPKASTGFHALWVEAISMHQGMCSITDRINEKDLCSGIFWDVVKRVTRRLKQRWSSRNPKHVMHALLSFWILHWRTSSLAKHLDLNC